MTETIKSLVSYIFLEDRFIQSKNSHILKKKSHIKCLPRPVSNPPNINKYINKIKMGIIAFGCWKLLHLSDLYVLYKYNNIYVL